ncbi:hypothetical protein EJ06DRAFT_560571 [Trichodelitschia bisporula]|uniref:DUF7730 domain-containing protein n=1 Tax=Trichodelitschia bisporula TaxID=703511 RepID=A0A6G1HI43_9PEZI|nr:hypothetical protein EJ06DRAFT_560571 [Trichodelitschia bisporula]
MSIPTFPFLRLPGELRNKVYDAHFGSITIGICLDGGPRHGLDAHGYQKWDETPYLNSSLYTLFARQNRNCLALLRTSKQIYQETKDYWAGRVLFDIPLTEDFLDFMHARPQELVRQIRHVRTAGFDTKLWWEREGAPDWPSGSSIAEKIRYHPAYLLKFLPPMTLDTLTVVDEGHFERLADWLVSPDTWKELRFYNRTIQPWLKFWLRWLEEDLNVVHPGASITMVDDGDLHMGELSFLPVTTMSNQHAPWMILLESASKKTSQSGQKDDDPWAVWEGQLDYGSYAVIVKLPREAHTAGKRIDRPFPFPEDDVRCWAEGMTWARLRLELFHHEPDEDYRDYCTERLEYVRQLCGNTNPDTYDPSDPRRWYFRAGRR